ncbi:glycosyltransferase [Aquibacillus halophilus]|uniref:Glycosyltransferase n=1 Tax=Aquibacillus halophilus TaxID=930132 RepID=A0A6A8DFZ4_9BACI|nr:glycosyltransferase [Aquibacillus halophilus]MRH42701.1 glycosyltransferase [Aquibacillus halophilus]
MKPKISIIVPVYNIEQYLRKCLDSILAQTFTDFEVIIVNDGSTDSSGDICDEYAELDNRVRVIHTYNGGLSSARNVGLKLSRGDFVGFIDGDDWVFKDMYQTLYELCNQTNSDISICTMYREIEGEIVYVDRDNYIKEMDNVEAMRQLFKGNLYRFAVWNKLYTKKCFEHVQFPEGRIHEDLFTTYKVFAKADKVVFTNYAGYIYVKRDSSILTTNYNEKRLDAFLGWNEIISFMNKNYSQLAEYYLSCFAYWVVDNVYYITSQVQKSKDRKKFLSTIQNHVENHYKHIIKSANLDIKYKTHIGLLKYDINLLLLSINFNKILNKRFKQ